MAGGEIDDRHCEKRSARRSNPEHPQKLSIASLRSQ
jgi:hypothetical protein